MGTYEDIRAKFDIALNEAENFTKSEGKFLVKNRESGTIYAVNKVDLKTHVPPSKEEIQSHNQDKEDKKAPAKKAQGIEARISSIEKQLTAIQDPDQKENAEKVLKAIQLINDPKKSEEEKQDAFEEMVTSGIFQRNSTGKKIYLDPQKTGLFYKSLGDSESPMVIQKLAQTYGIEDIPKRLRFGIDRKAMTGAKLMADNVGKMKIKATKDSVSIDGFNYKVEEIPSLDKMKEIYGSEEEAQKAIDSLGKYNKIIASTAAAFENVEDAEILSPVKGISPTTPENRKKLRDAMAGDIISEGFAKQFKDKKPSKDQQQVLDDFKSLKDIEDPKEWDKKILELTGKLMTDDFFKTGASDTVELVSYARELNAGNMVYLPAASNFPLGDIISMSPTDIDFKKDSPEEIRKKIQLINVGIEKRSIKHGAGGASSSGEKINLTEFKEYKDIPQEQVKLDLGELSDKNKLYKDIFDGDTKAAHSKIKDLAKKYDFDLTDEKYVTAKNKSIEAAIANIMSKDNVNEDEDVIRARLSAYYDQGKTMEFAYNNTVSQQLFTNEVWGYDKKNKTADVNRTDGINQLARLKFEFSVGSWGPTGKPGNTLPTRFRNDKEVDEKKLIKL